jgi:hypothetical protein
MSEVRKHAVLKHVIACDRDHATRVFGARCTPRL